MLDSRRRLFVLTCGDPVGIGGGQGEPRNAEDGEQRRRTHDAAASNACEAEGDEVETDNEGGPRRGVLASLNVSVIVWIRQPMIARVASAKTVS